MMRNVEKTTTAIITEKILTGKKADQYFRKDATSVMTPGLYYSYLRQGLRLRQYKLYGTIEVIIPVDFKPTLLRLRY